MRFLTACASVLGVAFTLFLSAGAANAQATRTWVSGVGSDANPCSRTAPCKTFAGAISQTLAGGEINCLDPGGYGAVTITLAISIICDNTEAGVLGSGTNAIVVNAGVNDVVILRGLDIEGVGTGINGISFIGGKALHVDRTLIRGFATDGINFAPNNANASLFVNDTTIADNPGGGILIKPQGAFTAKATITNTQMLRSVFGLRVEDRGKATVDRSTAASNSNNGFLVVSASTAAEINISHSISANNGTNGVQANGASALIRILDTQLVDNATGIGLANGGAVASYSQATNANVGNTNPSSPNGSVNALQ